jgi:myosin-1
MFKSRKNNSANDWKADLSRNTVGVDDMTLLSTISESEIKSNLEKRFDKGVIYTNIGHVLISVNPYRNLPIYSDEILKSYIQKNRIEMPPHIFSVAEGAYRHMCTYEENQCIIISGESGAGKTEAAKKILHYITHVSGESNNNIAAIKERVISTNPLLESFGNAKTLRNNNSSRFGKYLEIVFNKGNEPVGAITTNYLLEKSRVVSLGQGERNFHIFYQLCAGATDEMRQAFCIYSANDYVYTVQGNCLNVADIDDQKDFNHTLESMDTIGFSKQEQHDIIRLLAAILWLGNLQFGENVDKTIVTNTDVLDMICYLLQIDSSIMSQSFLYRIMETKVSTRNTVYNIPLNPVQANAIRDTFAKAVYDRLFTWIIRRVNDALINISFDGQSIGILDIYGFEIFQRNSFEQLCINYVNEKLQQIFVDLTLKSEQEEYIRENIQWTNISYFDNKIVCQLIEEKRPPGVFSILNDVVATAHADIDAADRSFAQRLCCISNKHFVPLVNAFKVVHFAGDVIYDIDDMAEKNKDHLSKDLLVLLDSSDDAFLKSLFSDEQRKTSSAADKIKLSANCLVDSLMKTEPSYVRCIKPNEEKSPREYSHKSVLHQIKYLGLVENIRVRRAGYCFRQTFEEFLEHFFLLSRKTSYAGEYIWTGSSKDGCLWILRDLNIDQGQWQIGKSKVFIRHPETLWALERLRQRYWHNMATKIQRCWKNYIRKRQEAATKIQRAFKEWMLIKDVLRFRASSHNIYNNGKARRRFSVASIRRFFGDYIYDVELCRVCGVEPRRVVFTCPVNVVRERFLRSPVFVEMELLLTKSSLILVEKVSEKNGRDRRHLKAVMSVTQISKLLVSPYSDNFLLVKTDSSVCGDFVLECIFKSELCAHLNRLKSGFLNIEVSNRYLYT